MFIGELVEQNRVSFHESFDSWEEAIKASCKPLIDDGTIEDAYVESVIASVKEHGPYIIIMPDVALPHAQENAVGVNDTAISFMKVEEPVRFEEGNPEKDARLFFTLASADHNVHLENMGKLAEILMNQPLVDELLQAKNVDDLIAIDEKYSE